MSGPIGQVRGNSVRCTIEMMILRVPCGIILHEDLHSVLQNFLRWLFIVLLN